MTTALLLSIAAVSALSTLAFPFGIRIAHRFRLLDLPTARKRHGAPIPIVGGVCIFSVWTLGMICLAALSPRGEVSLPSLAVLVTSLAALVLLGLWDDTSGLSPRVKLLVQTGVAAFTLIFEPSLHALCLREAAGLPVLLAYSLIYAPAMIWLVGIMNAINLIDGIDGFAGGTSLLVAIFTLVLNWLPGGGNAFGASTLLLAIPPLAMFLRYNWNPAKIFLGDNGSLSLGYLLAWNGLIHRAQPTLSIGIPCLLIMHAYPILDMGLCTYRRFRNGHAMFKADRSHLHHRIQRIGLSKSKTTMLLLCVVAYSQIMAIFINSVHFQLALVAIASFALSMFIFLFFLRSVEDWKVRSISEANGARVRTRAPLAGGGSMGISINLRPLLEVGYHEERADVKMILSSLSLLIGRSVRAQDEVFLSGSELRIVLRGGAVSGEDCANVVARIRRRLDSFQSLYQLQYSATALPVVVIEHDFHELPLELATRGEHGDRYAS